MNVKPSVCHICESDGGGGAAKAAFRLHIALKENGASSCMCVLKKTSSDDDVHAIKTNRGIIRKIKRRLKHWNNDRQYSKYKQTWSEDLEIFTNGLGIFGSDLVDSLPKADIYNLHWFHHLVDLPELFRRIAPQSQWVWRMPDMNPFTGGCHYSFDCDRFVQSCGACPLLGSKMEDDYSRRVFSLKQKAFELLAPSRVKVVAISEWQRQCARSSALMGRFDVRVIHPGIDCRIFAPQDKLEARRILGIAEKDQVLCFSAESLENRRKGYDLLLKALFSKTDELSHITLLSIGNRRGEIELPFKHIHLGRLEKEELLAQAYSAADVFVLPAREEAFGQVVIEAMACGLPVISFRVGGLPDIIKQGEHGYLCEAEDTGSLGEAVIQLLKNDEKRRLMSLQCREHAMLNFNSISQADKYWNLYLEMFESKS